MQTECAVRQSEKLFCVQINQNLEFSLEMMDWTCIFYQDNAKPRTAFITMVWFRSRRVRVLH